MSVKNILRDCEVFATLSDEQLEKIAKGVQEKQFEAGASIFHDGDNADELYVLQEGKVALQMTLRENHGASHRKVSVDVVSPSEVIGWPIVVEPYTHTLTAVCLQNVKVLSIDGNSLRWFLQDDLAAAYEVLKGIIKVVVSRLEDTRRLLISERISVS